MAEWTQLQWDIFNEAFKAEIQEARLANKVIPETDMGVSTRSVSRDVLDYVTGVVDDVTPVALEDREKQFMLTRAQAEDDADLSSAQVIVRRAAQQLAREDDERVFVTAISRPIAAAPRDPDGTDPSGRYQKVGNVARTSTTMAPDGDGEGLVAATAAAVAALDNEGYRSGYVLVAGMTVFKLLHTRAAGAADLPVVAVKGLLGSGPVHRCSVLDADEALVLSVGAGRIDRAVAVPPIAEFLRIESGPAITGGPNEELRVWRLYERFLTRFKETRSAVLLRLDPLPTPQSTDQPQP